MRGPEEPETAWLYSLEEVIALILVLNLVSPDIGLVVVAVVVVVIVIIVIVVIIIIAVVVIAIAIAVFRRRFRDVRRGGGGGGGGGFGFRRRRSGESRSDSTTRRGRRCSGGRFSLCRRRFTASGYLSWIRNGKNDGSSRGCTGGDGQSRLVRARGKARLIGAHV